MRKSFLELRYLEEKKLDNEIMKIDNAGEYYKMIPIFNSMALIFFIMNLVIVILAIISQYLFLDISDNILIVIFCFTLLAFISLMISMFYKHKTMEVLKQHYEIN